KGPTPFDIGHRLVLSSVYELPFGKGKPFLSGASGALNTLLGGWQVSGIATFQTGPAVTPFLSFDNSNAGGNRPDVIRDPNKNGPKTIQQWFDIGAFTNPPTLASVLSSGGDPWRAQGNSGFGIIRGPGLNLFDLAVMKRFSFFESHTLQFRAEFFNAFNHPNFGSPVAQFPVVPNFTGRIFGTSTPARQIQFGLRYDF
ncbi:MAG: carboxypeptidase regulatory-like domain-containing protein, partial [Acidobacteria bacterium]|nr:carboxypeptidase regulatory-like domain-containing protein [Acidobacteriota bacterium]